MKEINGLGNKEIMAENIKRMMEIKHVTSSEVCKAIDVPKPTFSSWIHGRAYPRIDKIERMAMFFGVPKYKLVEDPAVGDYEVDTDNLFFHQIGALDLSYDQQKQVLEFAQYIKVKEEIEIKQRESYRKAIEDYKEKVEGGH